MIQDPNIPMPYVITCGDEGVQINVGRKIAVVGAGLRVEDFEKVLPFLRQTLGDTLAIASSQENDWAKQVLDLNDWEQVNASVQQHTQAMADQLGLSYAGYLPFSDPQQLQQGVKGHMVRPHNVHIANSICFTLGGGEQTYHLGHFVISADWVAKAPTDLVRSFMQTQIDFYTKLSKLDSLIIVLEEKGDLGEEIAAANKQKLTEAGILK